MPLVLLVTVLLVFLPWRHGQCAQVTLLWEANTEPEIAGYKVYFGTATGTYLWNTDAGNLTTYTLSDLDAGFTYYFAVKAYNAGGHESDFSNEVSYSLPGGDSGITTDSSSNGSSSGTTNYPVTPQAEAVIYTILATSGAQGSIFPSGQVEVVADSNQTFTITAAEGHRVANVIVDGVSMGATTTYTFANVTANHTISVYFRNLYHHHFEGFSH